MSAHGEYKEPNFKKKPTSLFSAMSQSPTTYHATLDSTKAIGRSDTHVERSPLATRQGGSIDDLVEIDTKPDVAFSDSDHREVSPEYSDMYQAPRLVNGRMKTRVSAQRSSARISPYDTNDRGRTTTPRASLSPTSTVADVSKPHQPPPIRGRGEAGTPSHSRSQQSGQQRRNHEARANSFIAEHGHRPKPNLQVQTNVQNANTAQLQYARPVQGPTGQFGTGALGLVIGGHPYPLSTQALPGPAPQATQAHQLPVQAPGIGSQTQNVVVINPGQPRHAVASSATSNGPADRDNRASAPQFLIRTDLRYCLSQDTVEAHLELPGMKLPDVIVKVVNKSYESKQIVVSAYSSAPRNRPDYLTMQERMYGHFMRTLVIPGHVQVSGNCYYQFWIHN
jgi:hypothetical protein